MTGGLVDARAGWRVVGQLVCRTPGTGQQLAAAVGADAAKRKVGARGAESAFERTDARLRRIRPNRVEAMVQVEGETPETQHFDAAKWVGEWIQRPQPALGGVTPAELMDTPSGRDAVMRLLGAIQSGAYQ